MKEGRKEGRKDDQYEGRTERMQEENLNGRKQGRSRKRTRPRFRTRSRARGCDDPQRWPDGALGQLTATNVSVVSSLTFFPSFRPSFRPPLPSLIHVSGVHLPAQQRGSCLEHVRVTSRQEPHQPHRQQREGWHLCYCCHSRRSYRWGYLMPDMKKNWQHQQSMQQTQEDQ